MAVVRVSEDSEEVLAKYRRPGVVMMTPERATPALRCWACRRSEKSAEAIVGRRSA